MPEVWVLLDLLLRLVLGVQDEDLQLGLGYQLHFSITDMLVVAAVEVVIMVVGEVVLVRHLLMELVEVADL